MGSWGSGDGELGVRDWGAGDCAMSIWGSLERQLWVRRSRGGDGPSMSWYAATSNSWLGDIQLLVGRHPPGDRHTASDRSDHLPMEVAGRRRVGRWTSRWVSQDRDEDMRILRSLG